MNPNFCPDMIGKFADDEDDYEPEIREYRWYWVDPKTKEPTLISGWYKDKEEIRKEFRDAPRNWFNCMWPTERIRGEKHDK